MPRSARVQESGRSHLLPQPKRRMGESSEEASATRDPHLFAHRALAQVLGQSLRTDVRIRYEALDADVLRVSSCATWRRAFETTRRVAIKRARMATVVAHPEKCVPVPCLDAAVPHSLGTCRVGRAVLHPG